MNGRLWRQWRTPVTLILMVGLLGFGAWYGYTRVVAPPPEPEPTACVPQKVSKGEVASSQITVKVFNGGKKRGLAGDVGIALRGRDFKVTTITNTDRAIDETIIVGASEDNPEVELVAKFFKKAKIESDGRSDRSVDVLVGDKYAGFNKKAKKSVKVEEETVCLPAQDASPGASVSPTAEKAEATESKKKKRKEN